LIDILTTLAGKWDDGTRPKDIYAAPVATDPLVYLPRIIDALGPRAGAFIERCVTADPRPAATKARRALRALA
jgi:hypothetical protein